MRNAPHRQSMRRTRAQDGRVTLLLDLKTKRPGCALLQAVFGGDYSALGQYFNARYWLTTPTKDMQLISGTPKEWERLRKLLDRRKKEVK